MIKIYQTDGPALSSGALSATFDNCEGFNAVGVFLESPSIDDYAIAWTWSTSGPTVTATFYKTQVSGAVPTWGTLADTDLTAAGAAARDCSVTIVADCY